MKLIKLVNWHLKSGSKPSVFDTFDLRMCFAPQRRALFSTAGRHREIQEWPGHAVIWLFLLKMRFAPQQRALFRHLNFQKWSKPQVFWHVLLPNVLHTATASTFSTSQFPKVAQESIFFALFASKCASRHNGVHFFDISTSKSGPSLKCFDTFHVKMCFAPQRRAIFHVSSAQMSPHPPL